ncbi:MAG TPA: SDR family oxidoreductase [Nitriliruptoraceae bacterium]|nr:SDR family oxidoreductase [Nitriliruptoraceae bacterium]
MTTSTSPRATADGSVVVTGAAGGIGAAVVDRLVSDGLHVIAVDLAAPGETMATADAEDGTATTESDAEDGTATTESDAEDGPADVAVERVTWVLGDLTTVSVRDDVVAATSGRRLVGLVNVAGITRDARLANMDDDMVAAVLAVNAQAPLDLSLALADRIVDGGAIVNISSRSHLGNFGQVNYSASKGAIVGTTIAMSRSLAPRIRVNAIAPGIVATAMTAAMPTEVLARITAKVPLDRAGEPSDIAAEVAHLLSEDAAYVTGQVVYVCGGRSR